MFHKKVSGILFVPLERQYMRVLVSKWRIYKYDLQVLPKNWKSI